MEAEGKTSKARRIAILLAFFIGLIVLLSINWETREINPVVLLFGILVASIIWMARRFTRSAGAEGWPRFRFCPACGRNIPWLVGECPYCGHAFPPMRPGTQG